MRPMAWRLGALLGVAAAATLSATLIMLSASGSVPTPIHHRDGLGPLGSTRDPGSTITFGFDPAVGGPTWTVGIRLCVAQGDQSVVISGPIKPSQVIGVGFRYLGAFARVFTRATGATPIYSAGGFPPTVSERLQATRDFTVGFLCPATSDDDASAPYVELLLGIGNDPAIEGGGGWQGIEIAYSVGKTRYVVSLGYDIFICTGAVRSEYC